MSPLSTGILWRKHAENTSRELRYRHWLISGCLTAKCLVWDYLPRAIRRRPLLVRWALALRLASVFFDGP